MELAVRGTADGMRLSFSEQFHGCVYLYATEQKNLMDVIFMKKYQLFLGM